MVEILAPLTGKILDITEVPDPVFAQGIVGPGVAIEPESTESCQVVAPISGLLKKIHPHAFVIAGDEAAILVHLGLDTVRMKGEGFTIHAQEGTQVETGQLIISWLPQVAIEAGYSVVCPVIVMGAKPDQVELLVTGSNGTHSGAPLLQVNPKQ